MSQNPIIKNQFNNEVGIACTGDNSKINIRMLSPIERKNIEKTIFILHYNEDTRYRELLSLYAKSRFNNCHYKNYDDDDILELHIYASKLKSFLDEKEGQKTKQGFFAKLLSTLKK